MSKRFSEFRTIAYLVTPSDNGMVYYSPFLSLWRRNCTPDNRGKSGDCCQTGQVF